MTSIPMMAWKDLKLMRRDRVGLFFILGFPIAMGLFFGFIFGGSQIRETRLEIAVIDDDRSEMSMRFLEILAEDGGVTILELERHDAVDRVRRGALTGFIGLPQGFGETAGIFWMEPPTVELGVDPSRRAEAGLVEGLVFKGLGRLTAVRFREPASMRPLVQEALGDARRQDAPPALRPLLTALYEALDELLDSLDDVQQAGGEDGRSAPEMELARLVHVDVTREAAAADESLAKVRSRWDISFPQATLWGVLACAATFATTIVRENVTGTMLRLQIAPVARGEILAGKAAACFLAAVGVVSVMIVIGACLGMRPDSYAMLAGAVLCIAYCFSGIMMLMAVVGRTEEAVAGAAWGANMVMAMFGGGMVPLAFMPDFLRPLSHFSPVKWAILSLEGAIWRGLSWPEIAVPYVVLWAVGSGSLGLGAFLLSRRTSG